MLKNCRISGFADEINRDFDVQMAVLKELGQKYVVLQRRWNQRSGFDL